MPHIIRLNRVWELRLTDELPTDAVATDALVSGTEFQQRIDLPWTPSDSRDSQTVLLTRRFNRPSNLSADHMVHLAIEPANVGQVYFNGELLAPPPGQAADAKTVFYSIGDRLRDNNRMDVAISNVPSLASASIRLLLDGAPTGDRSH